MSKGTSIEELYTSIGAVVFASTGRDWWKGYGQKVSPQLPYALIILSDGKGLQNPVVENVELAPVPEEGATLQQIPWGTLLMDCEIRFIKSSSNNTALEAATRFKNSLRLRNRSFELWEIMGISGEISLVDVSSVFRADIESRIHIKFKFYANVSLPYSLEDDRIEEIESQSVDVSHINSNLDSLDISVEVDKP